MRQTALLLALLAAAPAAGAELYRWVDENGTVNYSNSPPPKASKGKPATLVEDRLSVYTPEKSVTEAMERKRNQPAQPANPAREPEPHRRAVAPPPPPPVAYDPCLNSNDRNCPGVIYDGSPVFQGRRRQQPLVQPQIPPGTIAGQATGANPVIPGLSGVTPPAPAPFEPSRAPGSSGRDRPRDRDYPRH